MAENDGTGSPDDADEVTPASASAPLTGWQRLAKTFVNQPGPRTPRPQSPAGDLSHLSDAERKRQINQIDATERRVGFAAGALAALFALIYTIPYMVRKVSVSTTVKPVHKTCAEHFKYTLNAGKAATCNTVYPPSHYAFPLVLWLVLAAAIFVAVRIGRRAPLAFLIVITGLAFGTFILFVPFLVGGGWLLLRAWRTQRYGSPTARAPVEGYVRPTPAAARREARASSGSRNATRRRRAASTESSPDARRPPEASKRYTPKTPTKKRPPPPKE